ncbi:MAG: nucleotidyltransferase family protein [Methylococcales bacterium]
MSCDSVENTGMNRQELARFTEAYIQQVLRAHLPADTPVYLFGSRARQCERWNSDYDLWIDAEIARQTVAQISDDLDDSFVPFNVDLVLTSQLSGVFGDRVKRDAKRWM